MSKGARLRAARQESRPPTPTELQQHCDEYEAKVHEHESGVELHPLRAFECGRGVLVPRGIFSDRPNGGEPWMEIVQTSDLDSGQYTAIVKAGLLYWIEAGWDMPPLAQAWAILLTPWATPFGDVDVLVGFAALGASGSRIDTLHHLWVAAGYRRQGVAGRMIRELREIGAVTRLGGPFSPAGKALVEKVAPDLPVDIDPEANPTMDELRSGVTDLTKVAALGLGL
jgi:hypothetical protein